MTVTDWRRTRMSVAAAILAILPSVLWGSDEQNAKPARPPENKAERKPSIPVAKDEKLRQELIRRVREDQEFRRKFVELRARQEEANSESLRRDLEALTRKVIEIDEQNTARMNEIVNQYGWPTITLVGADGSDCAWLLVQHADRDPAFQKRCLGLLAEAYKRGEVSASNLARLTDRVRVNHQQKQVYGTMYQRVDGKLVPRPIEDEPNVDQRRKELGLSPLAEFLRAEEQAWVPKK